MKLKKLAIIAVGAALALGLSGCANETGGGAADPTDNKGALIGISMPTTTLERWNNDGAQLVKLLQEKGYKTDLQYADNKTDMQISQIQNMINQNAKVLVIAAIDGTVLGPVLQNAADAGIKILAYDRLINKTPNVDYYATFDNYQVGKFQGQYIIDTLGLAKGQTGPFTLEPFAGSPDDNNAKFFFSGAWDLLLPYVQSGVLKVPSGKSPANNDAWQSIGIQGWTTATAQNEMENRLNSFYANDKVDVALSPNDSLALGIEQALDGAGYQVGVDWPIVTGQDGDLANVKNIIAGKQAMTVWKDTRTLGEQAAKMVDQILTGATVDVNNTDSYNNGVKNVPSYLLSPVVVTKDNIQSTLIASGFYTAAQLGL